MGKKNITKDVKGEKKTIVTPKKQDPTAIDPEAKKAKDAALAIKREQRLLKSAKKDAAAGFEALGTITESQDIDWLNEWLQDESRRGIVPFVCSLARQGQLEKAWKGGSTRPVNLCLGTGTLGIRIVSRPNQKFRAIGSMMARSILSKMLGISDLETWFKGEDKIDADIAPKALFNILGVMEGSPLPSGHEFAWFEVPLLWLFIKQWEELGKRGQGATKTTLDDITDYFTLKADPTRVVLNFRSATVLANNTTVEQVVDIGCDMTKATDWFIAKPHSYQEATIISDTLGIDQSLRKKSELTYGCPTFDAVLTFPQASEGTLISFNAGEGQKEVDKIIAAMRTKTAKDLETPAS